MKVKNIHFKNHKVLKNLDIDFTNNGEVLDTVVIAGINGSGKTNLLKYIYDYFYKEYYYNNNLTNSLEILFEKKEILVKEKLDWGFINYLKFYEHYKKMILKILTIRYLKAI